MVALKGITQAWICCTQNMNGGKLNGSINCRRKYGKQQW
ncbi:hypothetical protein T03_2407, partial [Trichinella britovi]